MSKSHLAFLPINIRIIVFKPFIPNEEIGFSRFSYYYDHSMMSIPPLSAEAPILVFSFCILSTVDCKTLQNFALASTGGWQLSIMF